MKYAVIVLLMFALLGCSKTWDCTATIQTVSPDCSFLDNTATWTVEFEGSKEEAEQLEIDGADSSYWEDIASDCDYYILEAIDCK